MRLGGRWGEYAAKWQYFTSRAAGQPYLVGRTALLHEPLCSGVARSSVDSEPVMRGLFLELESHQRSNSNQPTKLHALELKQSKSLSLACASPEVQHISEEQ